MQESKRQIGHIEYIFTRKRVKNINLRIRSDGSVAVSAPSYVPLHKVDEFVLSKSDFIENARRNLAAAKERDEKRRSEAKGYSKEECEELFKRLIDKYYVEFEPYGVPYPKLRIRDMKSRWGSCIPSKGVITLNSRLMGMPVECIEYVVVHEYCHFLEQNHSDRFYAHVARHMPDWKERRKRLNNH